METKTTIPEERVRPKVLFAGEKGRSKTKQSFAKEANINNIMAQYVKTGVLPQGQRKPMFGDFSSGEELQSIMDRVVSAELQFSSLPSDLRNRFNNSAVSLLDYLADPQNEAEAIELGLLPGEDIEPPAEPAAEIPAEPAPPVET